MSRFASEANRRLLRVLSIKDVSPIVVQERHDRRLQQHDHLTLPRGIRPGHVLKLAGLRRLGNAVDRRLYFPSPAIQFARKACAALSPRIQRDLQQGRRVTVVTFVPPHDVLETGQRLKHLFPAIRWVVVCQIVWALDEHYHHTANPRSIAKMLAFEGSRLKDADAIAVESEGVKAELQRLYQIPPERIHAIPNAYDESDLPPLTSSPPHVPACGSTTPFTLGFLGNCFKPPKVPGDRLLKALEQVVANGVPLRLKVVGDGYLDRNPTHVSSYPWVERHPRCSHHEALAALADSTALLLFVGRTPWTRVLMHAKLPYYLASGLPIIAIVPEDSNTAAIIRSTGTGLVIDSDADWAGELERCLRHWDGSALERQRNPQEITRFSWNTVARDWARCLSHPSTPSPS